MRLLDDLRLDVRYALRSLGRAPAFTATVLVLLALGIGVNSAMFSLTDAVLWRLLPVRDPQQLVFLDRFPGRVAGGFKKFSDISYPLMLALRDRDPLVEQTTTFFSGAQAATIDGAPEPVQVLEVADNFYELLGVGPAEGRLFQVGDGARGGLAVLSHGFWQRRFGGRPLTGSALTIGDTVYAIVGVTRPGFFGVAPGSEFDVSLTIDERQMAVAEGAVSDPRARPLSVVMARLRPGADADGVGRSLTALLRRMLVEERVAGLDPPEIDAHRIEARTASQGIETLRRRVSKPLVALMALVVLVLLITCANIANLQLARGAARQREMAVRLSIGAGRARLIRQLLVESLLLSAAGGLAGIVVAHGCLRALLALLTTTGQPALVQAGLDARTLLFTAAASIAAGVLFGVAPAWRASRLDVDAVVKRGGTDGRVRSMPSRLLVVAQVALSLVLVVGAGLLVRTFQNLVFLDAGFDRARVLAVAVNPQMAGLKGERVASLYRRTLERVALLPGVRAATFERNQPLSGGGSLSSIMPPGFETDQELITWFEEVGPHYAETLGLRLIAGRDLRAGDDSHAPRVLLINEAAAATFFPGQNPIGRRMGRSARRDDYEIVGVVANVRHQNLREAPRVTVYLPALQDPEIRNTSLLVRASGDPLALVPAIRQIVRDLEPSVPIMKVTTLSEVAASSLLAERLTASLATVFGVLALLVAGVGLSGVLLFGVARRTRELGVRMALGATMSDVAGLVLRESTFVVGSGVLIGLPCAWGCARLAQTLLFGLSPSDPVTLAAAVAMLAFVAAVASVMPARRAAAVNPVVALRTE